MHYIVRSFRQILYIASFLGMEPAAENHLFFIMLSLLYFACFRRMLSFSRIVLGRGSMPPPLRFNTRTLTILPPERSSFNDGPAEPSEKVLEFLTQLSISARDAASGLITSSLIAGRRSEAEDHGDVAFWVGAADETRLAESLLESLHIILPSDVSFAFSVFVLMVACSSLSFSLRIVFPWSYSWPRDLDHLRACYFLSSRPKKLFHRWLTLPNGHTNISRTIFVFAFSPIDLPYRKPGRSITDIAQYDQPC